MTGERNLSVPSSSRDSSRDSSIEGLDGTKRRRTDGVKRRCGRATTTTHVDAIHVDDGVERRDE